MIKVEREIGGKILSIETGKLARQATGAALVRYGDTVVLGTVVHGPARAGVDFFPLTVDYREKMSAAGRFPGGFFKREGRPTNKEILTMRMIDRPIRPLFPELFKDEIQIQVMVLSTDLQNDPDVIAFVSAAAALAVAPVPFNGPVAAVRVGRINGNFVLNPTIEERMQSDCDVVVAGPQHSLNMIEVGARELSEEVIGDAIEFGHSYGVVPICEMLAGLRTAAKVKVSWEPPTDTASLLTELRAKVWDKMGAAKNIKGKQERNEAVKAVYTKAVEEYCPPAVDPKQWKYPAETVKGTLSKIEETFVRERILKENKRPDSRKMDEIRPITCEIGWLPRVHGSALFSRGETQAMVVTTLGTSSDEQTMDEMLGEYSKRFMLHYNFPPFSVGEARRIGSPGRREIGHGALAERSIEQVMPSVEKFPYTVRLVSDILESNGSSSMATVCGSTLALMDAGVPITAPVAGISIGLVEEGEKYVLLADIIGEEDHFGDMDFKVAGTRKGITGIQLDIKTSGVRFPVMRETLKLALKCRLHILDIMERTIKTPHESISEFAPRLFTVKINPEKIGKVIGPGGKNIRAIQAETGAKIDIEDDGTVFISSLDSAGALRAKQIVEGMTEEIVVGRLYDATVIGIKDFGAFLELSDGVDGLCHISELSDEYVRSVNEVVKMGDQLKVKVISIDDNGRIKLSRKAVIKEEKAMAGAGGHE